MVSQHQPRLRLRAERRMVLFPHGQCDSLRHRSLCAELVLRCGGDLERVIDSPSDSVDRFATYVSRIRGLREGTEPALVVLTRTNPLALTIIEGRKRLESAVPALRRAMWVIYADADADPFFQATAERYGTLSGPLETVPVWVGPGPARFLVLSPQVSDLAPVDPRLAEMRVDSPEDTGVRRIPR